MDTRIYREVFESAPTVPQILFDKEDKKCEQMVREDGTSYKKSLRDNDTMDSNK